MLSITSIIWCLSSTVCLCRCVCVSESLSIYLSVWIILLDLVCDFEYFVCVFFHECLFSLSPIIYVWCCCLYVLFLCEYDVDSYVSVDIWRCLCFLLVLLSLYAKFCHSECQATKYFTQTKTPSFTYFVILFLHHVCLRFSVDLFYESTRSLSAREYVYILCFEITISLKILDKTLELEILTFSDENPVVAKQAGVRECSS